METLYQPLKERQFRVLLLKDDPETGFQCELLTLDTDISLAYVALSYTWGEPDDLDFVKVHGTRIPTRRNLARALQRLHGLRHGVVWADALCINQRDLDERASQVAMMGRIFEKAQQVLVWLGPVSEQTPIPQHFLNLFAAAATHRAQSEMVKYFRAFGKHRDAVQFSSDVVKCQYWSRAWIVQEIAVAAKVNILLAGHIIAWDYVITVVWAIYNPSNWSDVEAFLESDDDFDPDIEMIARLANVRRRKGDSLLTMLAHSTDTEQREEVDVVYSKLGLSSDADKLVPHVDYSKTCRQVLIELAENHVREKGNLGILCMVDYHPDGNNLPTWVPDWRSDGETRLTNYFVVVSPELIFRAGLDAPVDLPPTINPSKETLVVHGFVYDKCREPMLSTPLQICDERLTRTSGAKIIHVKPWDAVASFFRTACANHFVTLRDEIADVLPLKVVELLAKAILSSRPNATNYRSKVRARINNWSDRLFRHRNIDSFDSIEAIISDLDEWQHFSIAGRRLIEWLNDCTLSDSQRKFKVPAEERENFHRLHISLLEMSSGKILIEGERDGLYLVPEATEPGDEVCILAGCDLPMALRKQGDKYHVIGACYVDGIMHGEAMREFLGHGALQEFILI